MTSRQEPVGSPFGYRSTAREIVESVDLSGKRVVVTGGYSGIGTETVRALAGAGAEVIVGARRSPQAGEVLRNLEGKIAVLPLDLADPDRSTPSRRKSPSGGTRSTSSSTTRR